MCVLGMVMTAWVGGPRRAMAGRELGCVSETVRVRLAPGWRPVTADELPVGCVVFLGLGEFFFP